MRLKNRVIKNMSFDDYQELDLLNKSTMDSFVPGNSPRQSLYRKSSTGFNDGRIFHSIMEYRERENPEVVISKYDAFRTNEAKMWKSKQEADGKHVVTKDKLDVLQTASDICASEIKVLLDIDIDDGQGEHELTVVTETQKARLDYIRPEYIIDWKMAASAHPKACYKAIEEYNYDLQSVHYTNLYEEVTGDYVPFIFAFQEIKAPFNTCLVEVSRATKAAWDLGTYKYEQALERMKTVRHSQSYSDKLEGYEPDDYTLRKYNFESNPFN